MLRLLMVLSNVLFCIHSKEQILINELGIAPPTGSLEFIELYNKGSCPVDLSCYTIVFSGTSGGGNPTGWTVKIPSGKSISACGYFLIGGTAGATGVTGGTGYPTGGVVTSYPSADLNTGTTAVTANAVYMRQGVNAGTIPNSSGQITLLDSWGNVAASLSYNNGNNPGSYPLSAYTNCNVSGNTQGSNNISNPGPSSNNVNAVFTAAGNRGIYLDASGNYIVSGVLSPGFANPSQTGCAPTIVIASNPSVCFSSNAQTTFLTYSSTTNSPFSYSIAWNSLPVNSFANVTNAALPSGAVPVNVPAGTPAGIYTGTITVSNAVGTGCGVPFSVTVNAIPLIAVSPNTTICSGNATTLTATGGSTYSWNPAAGLSSTTGSTVIANPSLTTLYTVTGTDANGCFNSAQVTVSIDFFPLTVPVINTIEPTCLTPTGTIIINAPLANTHSYSIDGVNYQASNFFTNLTAGIYSVTVRNSNGCISSPVLTGIASSASPLVQFIDTAACELLVYNGALYSASTTINDTLRNQWGCDSVLRTIHIQINPKPQIILSPDKTICSGSSTMLTASATNASVQWLGLGSGNSIMVSPASTTTYTVFAISGDGCMDTAYATVTVDDFDLQLFASPNPAISGIAINLQTAANTSYHVVSWKPSVFFNDPFLSNQKLVADTLVTITAIAVSRQGCIDSSSVFITIDPLNDLFIPSAFTPNGDGRNDEFRILGEKIKTMELEIFNRWGQVIFSTRERTKGWNGNFSGVPQVAGVYVYLLKAILQNGRKVNKKGTVLLIR